MSLAVATLPPFERFFSEREDHMAFEDLQSELGLLMTRMQNEPHDRHELYLLIRQKLNEIRAYGMPLPDDLVQFERQLEAEFAEEQAGKSG